MFTTMLILIPYCVVVTWYVITYDIMTGTDWVLSLHSVWGNYGYTTDNHAFQNEAPEDPRTTIDCIFLLRFFVFFNAHRKNPSGIFWNV